MSATRPSIVVHAHCYQPPRADPWLGEIPRERSAAPYHDWNERILHECYGPLGAARVTDGTNRIVALLNTYEYLSFDVGATLLEWLERAAPDTYAGILDADRASVARLGHGNAIAAPYHHTILPLASRRDKVTEVRWGIDDFRQRFGRDPEGLWLPETAVDDETLDVLAVAGITFTILAPHQVDGLPPGAAAGRYTTAAGRAIALVAYDGPASHAVAFGDALRDATAWARDLRAARGDFTLLATDGETYGHHHTFGEMALAALLHQLTAAGDVRVENCAAYLARQDALPEVTVVPNTSWSCAHGVERWRADCGCRMYPERHTQQAWRPVLRDALEWLAGALHAVYERDGRAIFADPWAARDALGWIACRGGAVVGASLEEFTPTATGEQRHRALELLELERNVLRMFTSCAWFFDDLAGLEVRQALRAAARAVELAGDESARIEAGLLERLQAAASNDPAAGNGDAIYRAEKPPVPMPLMLAGAAAFAAAAGLPDEEILPTGVKVDRQDDTIGVTGACGGRTRRVRATPGDGRRPAGRVTVTDADKPGEPYALDLEHLPDRARERLTAHWRGVITARRLPALATARLREGERLETLAREELHHAMDRLEEDPSAAHVDAVLDLAVLAQLLDTPLPYDVLNRLVRLCGSGGTGHRAAVLQPLARYLGLD
ncbi:MAG TPA: DUF3536 domain-containing protein [Gemmatimonadales bacterium]|jgi:hypothetical protein